MNDRRFRLLLIWNTVLTVILLISLGANAVFVRAAGDPPVKVFSVTTDDADIGGDTSSKLVIDSRRQKRLMPIELDLSTDQAHHCVAVASLEIRQPQQAGRYEVALGWETGTFQYTSIRDLTFANRDPQNQSEVRQVTTVFSRKLTPGSHTLSLLGSKRDEGMPDLKIDKAAMFAICMPHNILTP